MAETTYLAYAKTGKEFEVEDALSDLGIPVWCGRFIESKRIGKRRKAEYFEWPRLPNYLFLGLTPHTFYDAVEVKNLYPFLTAIGGCKDRGCEKRAKQAKEDALAAGREPKPFPLCDLCSLAKFEREVESAYAEADRARRRGEKVVAEFEPGDAVEAIQGPFRELLMRFRRVVENSEPIQYEAELELFGRTTRVMVDPLDLRRAV